MRALRWLRSLFCGKPHAARPRLIHLVGAQGTGKTRVAHKLAEDLAARGATTVIEDEWLDHSAHGLDALRRAHAGTSVVITVSNAMPATCVLGAGDRCFEVTHAPTTRALRHLASQIEVHHVFQASGPLALLQVRRAYAREARPMVIDLGAAGALA